MVKYGNEGGIHELCEIARPTGSCAFYSFGIEQNWSFDTDLRNKTGCLGYGFDPTVTHPSQLEEGILFFQLGAMSLDPPPKGWTVISVPSVRRWLRHDHIVVLKMDCEGCEYSIAVDVLREDPEFFKKVDQFAIEVHVPKAFMKSREEIKNLALLYKLLKEAGLVLSSGFLNPCMTHHEESGCPDELHRAGYPCQMWRKCQNFLFARV